MAINFIPNDPLAGKSAPGLREQQAHADRPANRASFTMPAPPADGTFPPGSAEFVYWQCREAGHAALDAWEGFAGPFTAWQGNRKKLALLPDEGVDLNAFYNRASFAFFHQKIGSTTYFSGASTDVVAHEVGHGLLDAIRPQLWDAPYLEAGAFHEAFGDCLAVLTALNDPAVRQALLSAAPSLGKSNFVESTAEELSDGIRRLVPTHNAAEPRHAFNTFQYQLPETLPDDGGPGELINEVHSFGMLFSGTFYDLVALLFTAEGSADEDALVQAANVAGALLVEGARTAVIGPRFFQAVGRAMVHADEQLNAGAHRDLIGQAFGKHGILLGSNALLSPVAALSGDAPKLGRKPSLAPAARRDLAARLGATRGARLSIEAADLSGQRVARVVHTQQVSLGSVDRRLRGVTVPAPVPVIVGESGGRAAIMGQIPEPVSIEREVHAFVGSLLRHGQIELPATRGARAAAARPVSRETHRVRTVRGRRVLERVRFHCRRCD